VKEGEGERRVSVEEVERARRTSRWGVEEGVEAE